MKAGKSKGKAILRTLANKDAQNFATRRLLKDRDEVQRNEIPTFGVTAEPLEEDLFIWHGNVKGPEGTDYEGGVFHIELRIPQGYPHLPPAVNLLGVELPHPNVFGNKLCLDMLESSREVGQGWSSGYTILSILIQLQSFLFEKFYDNTDHKQQIRRAVENANQYKCSTKSCKHGGKLAAWPPFSSKEQKLEAFKIFESEKSLFEKELVCYHTKLNHKENALGLGLTISRVPRSGLIKQASPCLDYISLKAFIKEGIRHSSNNEKFTHWLPLYFGENKERTLHLAQRAISMFTTNHTKRFKEEMILDVFPKILITLIVQIIDEKRHCSIRILRIFAHCLCLYLLHLELYPKLNDEIEKQINLFIKDESKRVKDVIPNIGAFVSNFLVNFKVDQKEFFEAYVDEQFDRQVFWILRTIPELEDSNEHLEGNRAKIVFKHESTSYQIALCFKMLSSFFREHFKTGKNLLDTLSENFGKLPEALENELQKKIFEIAAVDDYEKYFEYIGLGKMDGAILNKRLRKAIENSKRKKYHGTDDEVLGLPSSEEQLQQLKEKLPKLDDFIDKDSKALKQVTEEEWKKACVGRWRWIKDVCENFQETKPREIASMSDDQMRVADWTEEEELNKIKNDYLQDLNKVNLTPHLIQRYPQDFTWGRLFLKLDIEDHLIHIDQNPDFHNYYDKLKIANDQLTSLVVPIVTVKNIKSGHYYLTALLTQLTKLQHLEILGLEGKSQSLNLSVLKSLSKGFNNFISNGGSLKEISFGPFTVNTASSSVSEISEKLFSPISSLSNLETISINNNNMMSFNGGKALSKVVTDHKNIIELNFSGSQLTREIAKDLADGLMRAKQLQKIKISNNASITSAGLASIVYNLAFSPKLISLDISDNNITSGQAEVVEALYKLLRISASLEYLTIKNFTNLNAYLTKEFFISLGEVRTLRLLDMSNSGMLVTSTADLLGKAIAFNSMKKGSLEIINMDRTISSISVLNQLYNSMHVTNHDHESWYGDVNKLGKMEGKDFEKIYHNNLKYLQFSASSFTTQFNYNSWVKGFNPVDIPFVQLLARSSKLQNIQFSQCNLDKTDADALVLALDPTRANYASQIRVLNLSRNNLRKEGIKTLATIFQKNQTLEVLDISSNKCGVSGAQVLAENLATNKTLKYLNLFANNIDVDGARAFEKTLKTNTVLEFIDFGHNRLRNEGLVSLARGIAANANSGLKYLGLRFNFITEDGMIDFLKKIYSAGNYTGKLKSLYIKNNNINEFGLYNIVKTVTNLNIKLHFDLFEKLKLLDGSLLERTVWVHPASIGTPSVVKSFFETTHNCGIVLDVRKRSGPKWSNRNKAANDFYFIEFAHPLSVTRALHVASKRLASLNGVNFRIYRAGSGTYIHSKPKKKLKSQTNVAGRRLPRGVPSRGGARGRGGRGARRG